jgi:PPOX class probable F420-dependent enzyme
LEVDRETLDALLERWPVGRLGTITPAGLPHQVPVVFVAVGDHVYMPLDGKRKRGRTLARVRNVTAHGCASLLLDAYHDDWQQLWWVRLDGSARVVTDEAELLRRVAERLRFKYPQYRTVEPFSGEPTVLDLCWQRASAWSQSGDLTAIRRAAELPP